MDTLVISLLVVNLLFMVYLVYRSHLNKPTNENVSITYFHEIQESNGLFKTEKLVKVKAQLFVSGLPVGQSFTICEQKFEKVDKELVNDYVQQIVEPLVKLGITVKKIT